MKRFRRILVTFDFDTDMRSFLEYTKKIADMARPEQLFFHHASEDVDIPEKVKSMFPALAEPFTDVVEERMKELVAEFFDGDESCNVSFVADEGEPLARLLNLIRSEEIDLVIVGRAKDSTTASVFAEKLSRKAPCSVLIVPEGSKPEFGKTVLASDFSPSASDALEIAEAFITGSGGRSLELLHVYKVPQGYSKLGKTREEFAEIMRQNAVDNFQEFESQRESSQVSIEPNLLLGKSRSKSIASYGKEADVDLLVMGARGRTGGAAVLLGSVTEKVIRSVDVPLLAVKKKGEGMDLLEAILHI